MKKILGITFGGVQRKTLLLVLLVLAVTLALFTGAGFYQNRQLIRIVGQTRTEQQTAISKTSSQTMQQVIDSSLTATTELQATVADNDFTEVINYAYMLRTIAEGLLENRESLDPLPVSLPDASKEGESSAFVLCEQGVDYTRSEMLGILSHMSEPMIAMHRNSAKIDGCYIGLADGTDLCVDEKASQKLDEAGQPIPFPVRQRPWYIGAVETDGLYFTDITRDAFSGKPLITCSLPVKYRGETVGVVGLDLVLDSMNDFVNSTVKESWSYIVSSHGRVILGPEEGGIFDREMAEQIDLRNTSDPVLSELLACSQTQTTKLYTVTVGDKEYYMVGAPIPSVGWSIINIVDKQITEQSERLMLSEYNDIYQAASDRFNEGVSKTTKLGLALLAAVLVISLLGAYFSTKKIVRPIEEMTKSIQQSSVSGKMFEMKDVYRTNDEVEMLAEAFADLSKKTKRYIEEITRITAEKERIGTELELATTIQSGMLPHVFPPFPGRKEIDLYASMDPAKEVGGDFYDFFLVDDDHLGLVIADVSGKGVPAALFMMASKIILQSVAMLGCTPAEILTKTNEAICSNNQAEMFVTVWLGILELSTGKLTAANAGHEYPVLKRPDGAFELYKDKHGFVIGGMDGLKYKQYELQLQPGTKLFLYTDGVPEATDAENNLFGIDRMLEALNEEPDANPEQLLKNVRRHVDAFVGKAEQFDDLTMLCLEYRGPEENDGMKELNLEATIENIPTVTAFVDDELEKLDCPMKARMQIDVAIDELFSNIARYAYQPETGPATVRVEVEKEPMAVILTFIDHGKPYDPLSGKDPDVTAGAEDRPIGGLGVFLVKKIMDDVRYEYRNGRNILRIKKQI